MGRMARILAVTDIHAALSKVRKINELPRDLTIVAGDMADNDYETAITILRELERGSPLLWVPGNCDHPRLTGETKGPGKNIHGKNVEVELGGGLRVRVAGVGGSLYTPFDTPIEYGEEQLDNLLSTALRGVEPGKSFIMVVHTPPYASGLDRIHGGSYVGSRVLRRYLRTYKPLLLITGHIHEAWGATVVEGVLTVNPGPLREGRYALIELEEYSGQLVVRVRTAKL